MQKNPVEIDALLWDLRAHMESQLRNLQSVHRVVDALPPSAKDRVAAQTTNIVERMESIGSASVAIAESCRLAVMLAKRIDDERTSALASVSSMDDASAP